jgi:asparagine synthetase B (glutamine-hydrolysing)
VGTSLSGGLDSSISAIASDSIQKIKRKKFIAINANQLMTEMMKVFCKNCCRQIKSRFECGYAYLRRLFKTVDDVFILRKNRLESSCLWLARFPKGQEHCTVMLNGQGSDEIGL